MRRIVLVVASFMAALLLVVHLCALAGVPVTDRHPWLLVLIPVLPACGMWVFADYQARGGPTAFDWLGLAGSQSVPKWARVVLSSAVVYAVVHLILLASMREHAQDGWVAALNARALYTVDGSKEFVRVLDPVEYDRLRAAELGHVLATALAAAMFVLLHCVTQWTPRTNPSMTIRPKAGRQPNR